MSKREVSNNRNIRRETVSAGDTVSEHRWYSRLDLRMVFLRKSEMLKRAENLTLLFCDVDDIQWMKWIRLVDKAWQDNSVLQPWKTYFTL